MAPLLGSFFFAILGGLPLPTFFFGGSAFPVLLALAIYISKLIIISRRLNREGRYYTGATDTDEFIDH